MSEENVKKGFDKTVTHRDEATGLITHTNPYTLIVSKAEDGGKVRKWERPPGSGNLFDNKNREIGRMVTTEVVNDKTGKKTVSKKYDPDAEHIAFVVPETSDKKLAREVLEKDAKINELEKQLAGIKAEDKKKKA